MSSPDSNGVIHHKDMTCILLNTFTRSLCRTTICVSSRAHHSIPPAAPPDALIVAARVCTAWCFLQEEWTAGRTAALHFQTGILSEFQIHGRTIPPPRRLLGVPVRTNLLKKRKHTSACEVNSRDRISSAKFMVSRTRGIVH